MKKKKVFLLNVNFKFSEEHQRILLGERQWQKSEIGNKRGLIECDVIESRKLNGDTYEGSLRNDDR